MYTTPQNNDDDDDDSLRTPPPKVLLLGGSIPHREQYLKARPARFKASMDISARSVHTNAINDARCFFVTSAGRDDSPCSSPACGKCHLTDKGDSTMSKRGLPRSRSIHSLSSLDIDRIIRRAENEKGPMGRGITTKRQKEPAAISQDPTS